MSDRMVLSELGLRLRSLRSGQGLSRRELAARSGLSERFLAAIETGAGNPSILKLSRIAEALGITASSLLERAGGARMLALLGLRGAGKSTVGAALAARLSLPFVELDQRVEEAAGLSLREIFEMHGEESYRRFEREALESVLASGQPAVVATGGGIVAHDGTYDLLRRHAVTIWLRATPDDHWDRVVAQGDHRPMANDPLARENLRELLARREPLYRLATHTIDTAGRSVDDVVTALVEAIAQP